MALTPRLLSRAPLVATATTSLVLLAACGSSGEADKTPSQILQDMAVAVKGVSAYHVSATGSSNGSMVSFDLKVAGSNTVSGSLTTGGATVNIVVVDGKTYFQGKDFFAQYASADAANLIGDSWVLVPASDASSVTQGLGTFTNTSNLGGCFSSLMNGSFTKSTGSVNGQPVVVLQSSMGYSIDVASSGTTYPVQITSTGGANLGSACGSSGSSSSTGGGTITFDSWGQSVTVTPPPNPLDFSSIGSGGTGSGAPTPEATPTPS